MHSFFVQVEHFYYNVRKALEVQRYEKKTTQENNALEINLSGNTSNIPGHVIEFLQLFLPATIAKRCVAILRLDIGIPVKNAASGCPVLP